MTALEYALSYVRRGWSVIPVGGDKRPRIRSWKPYQTRLPTEDEIQEWYRQWPDAGVAIVTGKVSGLVVLDVDPRNGGDESLKQLEAAGKLTLLASIVSVRTQSGGMHYYFEYPKGGVMKTRPGFLPGLDLKSDGGYVVAPPTVVPGTDRGWIWIE